MDHETELKCFLPKSTSKTDNTTFSEGTTVPGVSVLKVAARVKVEYWTAIKTPGYVPLINRKEAYFVFGPCDTVQQAANHAAANYPTTNDDEPTFKDVFVFFKDGMKEIAVTDANANVHTMFLGDNTMIISNIPDIFEIQRKEEGRVFRSLLFVLLGIVALIAIVVILVKKIWAGGR